jgi:ketosteroid isomerase-like protein
VTSTLDLVTELTDAVGRQDWELLGQRAHPDVVWRHNIGVGSPEEGEYSGREALIALYQRITEAWVSMRAVPIEVREVEPGVAMIKGELHAKHAAAEIELVTPYTQRLEFQDGLLIRGEMVSGPGANA